MHLLLTFLCYLNLFTAAGNSSIERTFVTGDLNLEVKKNRVEANLVYRYKPVEDGVSHISFYLSKDVIIKKLKGDAVKSFTFEKENKQTPFGKLTITFKAPLKKGEANKFTLSYSGASSKGFFTEHYKWIDIDPDFMILPGFTESHSFDYEIKARVDDPKYKFIDAANGGMASSFTARSTSATYFASIAAGSQLKFKTFEEDGYTVNIISTKPDSVVHYLGSKNLEILNFYNKTIGRNKEVKSFSILYRPMPDSVFRTMRNINNDRLIMFSDNHERINTLAHEISHFWWNRGDDMTMEKWLDESFAEYSELMYVRHSEGQQKFQEGINKLEKVARDLPPIMGSDRFGKNWSDILYFKAPFLLYRLETSIGKEKFMQLLNNLNESEVDTTENFLKELERVSGRAERDGFAQKLHQ